MARAAFVGFASALDQELGAWIDSNVTFPNSLVDRITPSVSAEDAARLNAASGLADQIPLVAEDFSQWVIEDRFVDGRPALQEVGVQFSDEVKLWEQVKVRVLNAGHLTLTYPALLLGYREVAEAMRDPQIPVLLERFLDKVVLPLLEAPRDVNLVDYKNTVLERFSNEAMHDQLTRIASDSASKVTVFLTTTLQQVLARGADHHIPAFILAAWSRVLQGKDDDGKTLRSDRAAPRRNRPSAADIGRSARSTEGRAAAGERCRRARRLRRHFRSLPQGALRSKVQKRR